MLILARKVILLIRHPVAILRKLDTFEKWPEIAEVKSTMRKFYLLFMPCIPLILNGYGGGASDKAFGKNRAPINSHTVPKF